MDKDGFWYLMNESQSGKMPYVCKANLNYRKEQEWHEQRGELLNCSTTHHGHSHDSGSGFFINIIFDKISLV